MLKKALFLTLLLLVALVPSAMAQDDDVPTVAIIRFGPLRPFELSQKGTLDMLEAYGYVDGENINLIFGDAEFDFPTANLLIENAIDEGADVIIAITTPVAQAAANATLAMENPPIVLFNTVTSPYAAGIAESACLKPAHITGSQALAPYESIVPLINVLDPEITVIGTIFNNAEANSVASVEIIAAVAEDLGLTLEQQPVTATSEVGTAAEALVSKGVQAFMISTDSTVSDGLPSLLAVAEENGIPIFHGDSGQTYAGATIGAGLNYYQEGVDTARMLISYLNGDIDIETTGISKQGGLTIGINFDSVEAEGIEIPDELLAMADFTIEAGESSEEDPVLPDVSFEELQAADAAFIENLFCSEERIAEQQAELDASS